MTQFLFLRKIILSTGLILLAILEGFSQQPAIYASISGGDLYSFDITNCTRRFIGSTNQGFGDLAFTEDGRLWGIGGGRLYHIDTATAFTTFIGNTIGGVSLVGLDDSTLLIESGMKLYGIRTSDASYYYIDTIGYQATGDLTWYDDDLYMVTGAGMTNGGVIRIELNSTYTAITNVTLIGSSMPSCEGAFTASFPGLYNSIVGFNGPNLVKICHINGTSEMLCPALNIGGTPGGAAMRLPTQNPKPTRCNPPMINNLYSDSMICAGDTFFVPFTVNNPALFAASNVFTVQLSNVSGGFGFGVVNIGSRVGNSTAPLSCVVPGNVVPGIQYRIRIISTNTIDTSGYNAYPLIIGNTIPQKPIATNNGPICPGDQLNLFANTTTTGVKYLWKGPNNFTSTLQNPTIPVAVLADSGDYIVEVSLFGCVATDTALASVTLSAKLITTTGNSPLCENDTIKLISVINGTPVGYIWNGPAGFSASTPQIDLPNAKPNMSGEYYLTVTYTGCTKIDTVNILVKPLPKDIVLTSNQPLCEGDTLRLNVSSSTQGVDLQWYGPLGFSSNASSPFISNAQIGNSGTYMFTGELNNCIVNDSLSIIINENPPKPDGVYNGTLCEGDTLVLNVADTSNGIKYTWNDEKDFESISALAIKANITLNDSGLYFVTAILGDCKISDTVHVPVKPKPVVPAISSNMPLYIGDTLKLSIDNLQNNTTYLWSGPDSFISQLTSIERYLKDETYIGYYTLRADSTNGCINNSYIQINAGDVLDSSYIILYPTPNKGSFYVKGAVRFDQQMLFHIYDSQGKLVNDGKFYSKNKRFFVSIPLENYLASGDYVFVLQISGGLKALKFTVIRE